MATETALAAPLLLVAVPQIGDRHFSRGVVLIIDHTDEGSMGILINRPSDIPMMTFCKAQQLSFHGNNQALIYQGGPVQTDRAFILHRSDHQGPETEHLWDGVRLSYSIESLRMLVQDPPSALRIYLGYAGWGPGQLADEINGGAWLVAQPSQGLLFTPQPEQVWELALRQMGIEAMQLAHSGAMH